MLLDLFTCCFYLIVAPQACAQRHMNLEGSLFSSLPWREPCHLLLLVCVYVCVCARACVFVYGGGGGVYMSI